VLGSIGRVELQKGLWSADDDPVHSLKGQLLVTDIEGALFTSYCGTQVAVFAVNWEIVLIDPVSPDWGAVIDRGDGCSHEVGRAEKWESAGHLSHFLPAATRSIRAHVIREIVVLA